MKKLLLSAIVILLAITIHSAQSTIAFQDFDNTNGWSYTSAPGDGSVGLTTDKSISGNSIAMTGSSPDIYNIRTSPEIEFDNISLENYSAVQLSFGFASSSLENHDELFLDISFDNGVTWNTNIITLTGITPNDKNLNFGVNPENPSGISNPFTYNIPPLADKVKVRFRFVENLYYVKQNLTNRIYLDNIRLTGTPINIGGSASCSGLATNLANESSSSVFACEVGSWTYYYSSGANNTIFAIQWGANNAAAKAAVEVAVTYSNSVLSVIDLEDNGIFLMQRYWNISNANLTEPVNMRFFYHQSEIDAVETETYLYGAHNGFVWFKNNTNFHTADVTPDFTPETVLTPEFVGQDNGVKYVQFNNISVLNGGGTGGISIGTSALPVELTSFSSREIEQDVLLEWGTASELNNEYFSIEHSTNGEYFTEIGRVQGKGTTTEANQYHFFDKNPVVGSNYYRLRQVDFTGEYEYSPVVRIYLDRTGDEFYVYPTLASVNPTVQIARRLLIKGAKMYVIDALGNSIMTKELTENDTEVNFDTVNFLSGHYTVKLQVDERNVFTTRFIKLAK